MIRQKSCEAPPPVQRIRCSVIANPGLGKAGWIEKETLEHMPQRGCLSNPRVSEAPTWELRSVCFQMFQQRKGYR